MDRTGEQRNRPLAEVRAAALRHRRPLGIAATIVATALAVLWTQVVPDRAAPAPALQAAVIRWAHPLCWALLAAAALCWALGAPKRLTETLAWLALGAYGAFLIALAT
jgi:hypothetical protein